MLYQQELKVALDVVKKASRLCCKVQKSLVDIKPIKKKDRSPVSIALDLVENGMMLGVLGCPNYSMELRKGTFLFDLLKSADYELNSDHCE